MYGAVSWLTEVGLFVGDDIRCGPNTAEILQTQKLEYIHFGNAIRN